MTKEHLYNTIQTKYFVPACFLMAAVTRLAWVMFNTPYPAVDEYFYFQTGINISKGLGYIHEGVPTAFFPVGYPAFLGLMFYIFGISVQIAKIANVILSLGSLWFFYRITLRLFESTLVARIALFLMSLFPDQIFYNALLMTETLFFFLLMFGLFLITSKKFPKFQYILAASVVFCLACYVKSQILFIPVLCFFWLVITKKCTKRTAIKKTIIMYTIILAMILPWTIRNFQLNKPAFISTNGSDNLLIGNNPKATGTFHLIDNKIAKSIGPSSKAKIKYIFKWISTHPQDYLVLLLKKMYFLYLTPEADPLVDLERCTLPQFFSQKEVNTILENIKENIDENACKSISLDNCDQLFLQSIILNEKAQRYIINPELNDQYKSHLAQLIIFSSDLEYSVEINRLWHLAWRYSRYAILAMFALYIIRYISSKVMKAKKTRPPGSSLLAMLIIGYFTLIYLAFFGAARFSFPVFPFMIMYSAFLLSTCFCRKHLGR